MPSAATWGALLGFGINVYANGLRKVPLMRRPWEHVIATAAGAAFGVWYADLEHSLDVKLQGTLHRSLLTRQS